MIIKGLFLLNVASIDLAKISRKKSAGISVELYNESRFSFAQAAFIQQALKSNRCSSLPIFIFFSLDWGLGFSLSCWHFILQIRGYTFHGQYVTREHWRIIQGKLPNVATMTGGCLSHNSMTRGRHSQQGKISFLPSWSTACITN